MTVTDKSFQPLLWKIIMTTNQAKLLKTLRAGKELTAKQITQMGFSNPYAAVANLRDRQCVAVYGNKRTLRDGTVVTKYRIGTPTRTMALAGFTS